MHEESTLPAEAVVTGQAEPVDWHALILQAQRAQEQAQIQVQHLNDVLEGLGDGLVLLDGDLRYRYVNPFTLRLMGRTQEEVLGQSFYDLYPDLKGTPYDAALHTALREQRQVEVDIFYPRNGRYWRTRINPTTAGLTIYFQDVTEVKATEILQQRLAAIVESSDDAIISKTLDSIITTWNPAAERMFGYTAEEVIGRPQTILFPSDRLEEETAILQRIRQGVSTDHFETIRIRKDGVPIHISTTISPIRDGAGRIVGASTIARDITERKYFEEERRYVLAGANCLLWHADVEDRGLPERLHWTISLPDVKAAQRFLPLRLQAGEVYQDAWYRSRLPEDRDKCDRRGTSAVRRGRSYQHDFRIVRADGSVRWLHEDVRVEAIVPGKRWRAVAVCTDITERKLLEMQLREETETLETVHRLGQRLSAELDLETLIQAATDAATKLTSAQFGAFFYNVIDSAGQRYTLYTLSGIPREAFSSFPMPRNTVLFAPTFSGERTVRLDDVTQDPRYGQNPPFYGKPPGHLPVVSYLAIPVVSRSGEVLGGLFFGHAQPGRFTERHERIVEGMAAQAAIAIDNARLFQAERERSEQLVIAVREVHHRVKNSLQGVSALLEMQLPPEGESVPVEAIQDSLNQIKAIALVHDLLAHDQPIGQVDVARVLAKLVTMLSVTMGTPEVPLPIRLDAISLWLPIQAATALALVVNELVTNAAKHAISPSSKDGSRHDATIQVSLQHRQEDVYVAVQDNGPGFPPDFDPVLQAHIGLELVQTLVSNDLKGHIAFRHGPACQDAGNERDERGACVEILFSPSQLSE